MHHEFSQLESELQRGIFRIGITNLTMIVLDVQITQQRTWRQNLQQKNVENNWKYYNLFCSFELIDYTDLHVLTYAC